VYGTKCIALFGDTKPIKELLKASFHAKFNAKLTHPQSGGPSPGWIMLKAQMPAVLQHFPSLTLHSSASAGDTTGASAAAGDKRKIVNAATRGEAHAAAVTAATPPAQQQPAAKKIKLEPTEGAAGSGAVSHSSVSHSSARIEAEAEAEPVPPPKHPQNMDTDSDDDTPLIRLGLQQI
jgi:hypothetical protein